MLKLCSPMEAGYCILATFWPDVLPDKSGEKGKGMRQGKHWGFGAAAKPVGTPVS